jgi:hypothetical protein
MGFIAHAPDAGAIVIEDCHERQFSLDNTASPQSSKASNPDAIPVAGSPVQLSRF